MTCGRPFVTVDLNPRTGNLMLGCETCGWYEDWPLNSHLVAMGYRGDEHEDECPGDVDG